MDEDDIAGALDDMEEMPSSGKASSHKRGLSAPQLSTQLHRTRSHDSKDAIPPSPLATSPDSPLAGSPLSRSLSSHRARQHSADQYPHSHISLTRPHSPAGYRRRNSREAHSPLIEPTAPHQLDPVTGSGKSADDWDEHWIDSPSPPAYPIVTTPSPGADPALDVPQSSPPLHLDLSSADTPLPPRLAAAAVSPVTVKSSSFGSPILLATKQGSSNPGNSPEFMLPPPSPNLRKSPHSPVTPTLHLSQRKDPMLYAPSALRLKEEERSPQSPSLHQRSFSPIRRPASPLTSIETAERSTTPTSSASQLGHALFRIGHYSYGTPSSSPRQSEFTPSSPNAPASPEQPRIRSRPELALPPPSTGDSDDESASDNDDSDTERDSGGVSPSPPSPRTVLSQIRQGRGLLSGEFASQVKERDTSWGPLVADPEIGGPPLDEEIQSMTLDSPAVEGLDIDEEGLTVLERIFLFAKSEHVDHREAVSRALPEWLEQVDICEAVEYVLPLLVGLATDEDKVKEALIPGFDEVMYYFFSRCPLNEYTNAQIASLSPTNEEELNAHVKAAQSEGYQTTFAASSSGLQVIKSPPPEIPELGEGFDSQESFAEALPPTRRTPGTDSSTESNQRSHFTMSPADSHTTAPTTVASHVDSAENEKDRIIPPPSISASAFDEILGVLLMDSRISFAAEARQAVVRLLCRIEEKDVPPPFSPDSDGTLDLKTQQDNEETPSTPSATSHQHQSYDLTPEARSFLRDRILQEIVVGLSQIEDALQAQSQQPSRPSSPNFPLFPEDPLTTARPPTPKLPSSPPSALELDLGDHPRQRRPSEDEPMFDMDESEAESYYRDSPDEPAPETKWPDHAAEAEEAAINEVPAESWYDTLQDVAMSSSSSGDSSWWGEPLQSYLHREATPVDDDETLQDPDVPTPRSAGKAASVALIVSIADAECVPGEALGQHLLPELVTMSDHYSIAVRRQTALALTGMARTLPEELIYSSVLPLFETLSQDSNWTVRRAICNNMSSIWRRVDAKHRQIRAQLDIARFLNDDSLHVRDSLLEVSGTLFHTFLGETVPDELLSMYFGQLAYTPADPDKTMLSPISASYYLPSSESGTPLHSGAFLKTEDRATVQAYNFPAVCLTMGRENWPILRDFYLDLVSHVLYHKVRVSLTSSLHEIAKIIGIEAASADLTPVYLSFLESSEQIQLNALDRLSLFAAHIDATSLATVLRSISGMWPALYNWRVREMVAKQLVDLCSSQVFATPAGAAALDVMLTLLSRVTEDDIASIRDTTVMAAAKLLPAAKVLGESERMYQYLEKLLTEENGGFRQRNLCATTIGAMASLQILDAADDARILNMLEKLSTDKVSNVRIGVAKALAVMCGPDGIFSQDIPKPIKQACRNLATEDQVYTVREIMASVLENHSVGVEQETPTPSPVESITSSKSSSKEEDVTPKAVESQKPAFILPTSTAVFM